MSMPEASEYAFDKWFPDYGWVIVMYLDIFSWIFFYSFFFCNDCGFYLIWTWSKPLFIYLFIIISYSIKVNIAAIADTCKEKGKCFV